MELPKEFIIKSEDVARIYEVMELQVPSGPARKIEAVLRKLKPYTPPAPPTAKPQQKPTLTKK